MTYASQTTSTMDNIIIQRSYLSSDSNSDYAVTFLSSHHSAEYGIILSISNWLVLDDRDSDSSTKERAQTALTVDSAKALVADLTRLINSL